MTPTRRTPRTKPNVTDFDEVITTFGLEVTKKLRAGDGSTEGYLRGPFRAHGVQDLKFLLPSLVMIGETQLSDLSVGPDHAVDVNGARIGYVELKQTATAHREN